MKYQNSPDTPFCKKPWKPVGVALILLAMATFAWGFHLLQDHVSGDNRVTSAFSRLKAVGVGAQVGGLDTLNRGAVVNIAATGATGRPESLSTGFIVNPNGYVVTALHPVQGRQTLLVRAQTLSGLRSYEAELVKSVPTHDLALLKIVSRDLFPFLAVGDSQNLTIGERLYTIGDPQGVDALVREATVTDQAVQLTVGPTVYANLIQTDALATWSETGGPVMNANGRVVGVHLVVSEVNGMMTSYAVPSVIMVSHLQDVVQMLSTIGAGATNAPVFAPAPALPAPITPVNPNRDRDMGVNAGFNQPGFAGGAGLMANSPQNGGNDQNWWTRARGLMQGRAGGAAGAGVFGQNVAAVTTTPLIDTSHTFGWSLWGYSVETIGGLLLLGLVSGISGGMMTMGGGIIKVTGLMLFFGYGILLVRPVAYLTNIFVYGAASLRYQRDNQINWNNVKPLVPWAVGGVIIGYFIGNALDARMIHYLLGAFALWLGVKIVREIVTGEDPERDQTLGEFDADDKGDGSLADTLRRNKGILGLPMGIFSGILGISGGVIEVPLQRYIAGEGLKGAIANSAVLVFFASLVCSLVAMVHGVSIGAFEWETPFTLAAFLIPGAYLGGMAGAWLTKVVPLPVLKWVYAALMFVIAIRMFIA